MGASTTPPDPWASTASSPSRRPRTSRSKTAILSCFPVAWSKRPALMRSPSPTARSPPASWRTRTGSSLPTGSRSPTARSGSRNATFHLLGLPLPLLPLPDRSCQRRTAPIRPPDPGAAQRVHHQGHHDRRAGLPHAGPLRRPHHGASVLFAAPASPSPAPCATGAAARTSSPPTAAPCRIAATTRAPATTCSRAARTSPRPFANRSHPMSALWATANT